MTNQLVNCSECLGDRHSNCTKPDSCLCAENNHGVKKEAVINYSVPITDELSSEKPKMEKWFQCTHCDYESKSFKAFEQCKKKKHEIIDIYIRSEQNKPRFDNEEKIDNVAKYIMSHNPFVTLRKTEKILLHTGKIYDSLHAESIIKEETNKLIPNCTKHDRAEVIDKIKVLTYTDLEDFDKDPNLITVENGILNLETKELSPHTPKHLSQILFPVEYHRHEVGINGETIFEDFIRNLKDTMFLKYLISSFTVKGKFQKEKFETVIEIIASTIVKRHIDEKAFMFLGNGENGKSVCLSYIESLLGKDNVTHIPLQKIASDKHMSADLDGKSANVFSDLEKNELRHTGEIKNIVSGEGLQVQKKYQDPFTLYPVCKLMFSCNRFPKSFDQSQGFFRRWIIVKWERNFENDPQRIPYLREKLEDNKIEKNLVFSNLVAIANKLNKVGRFTHNKEWRTIQKEWNENANPIDAFASNCIIDSDGNKTKRDTYQFYKDFCLEKGENPFGLGQFGKQFSEYYDEDRDNKTRVWLNIDFKRHQQTTLMDIQND